MQCGTFAQSLLSERFPGLSTADNGGAGAPGARVPTDKVTRSLALVLKDVLRFSGVANVKVDGCNRLFIKSTLGNILMVLCLFQPSVQF